MKRPKAIIDFKDPDFAANIPSISERARARIVRLAEFGEYFAFELEFDPETGAVIACKQVKAGS